MKKKQEPIRILQVVPVMQAAGIENFIMNVYRSIDRNKVQFDFLVHSKKKYIYDDEIEALGGKIYRFTYKDDKNFIKYVKDLDAFFKQHPEYKVVHGNMQSMMPVYLKIAKKNGVKTRIAHSHNSSYEKSLKGFILHMLSRFAKRYSNINFACSKEAAEYLFQKEDYVFIPNAIDITKYKFDVRVRNELRKKLNISNDTLVLGNVARLEQQKNHKKLIEVFEKVHQHRPNSILLLFGTGSLENSIKNMVLNKKLQKNVLFMGVCKEVYQYYNVMDVFILTSFYEGLPVTGIEAQTNGLPCVFSDAISRDTDILNSIKYIPLSSSADTWAKSILEIHYDTKERKIAYETVKKTKFNVQENVKFLEKLYCEYNK